MNGCRYCGGYTIAKPLCGGMPGPRDPRIMKRCRCNDTPMQKLAYAFAWVGYIVAIMNKQPASPPED